MEPAPVPIRLVATLLACSALALGAVRAQAAVACPEPIRFGLTAPLTGNLALLGVQARNGLRVTLDAVNAAGGIAGHKVVLDAQDTGSSSTDAISAQNRVIEGKPLVLFGSMISPHVFAQTPAATKAAIPFLVAATNAEVTNQGSPWLFRIHPHDGQLAQLVPRYLVETLHKMKPGIIAVADDYGLGASRGMQATFKTLGVAPVAVTSYAPTDKDMTAQLLDIKDKGADSVVVFGRPGDVAIVMKEIADLGLELTTIGNTSTVAPTTLANLSASEADGAYAVGGIIPQTSTDPSVLAWAKAVADKTKVPADNFAVAYADAVYLLKDVIERVGCDGGAIRKSLAETKGWKGMMISYTADGRGDLAHTLGVFLNKGKTATFVQTVNEPGF